MDDPAIKVTDRRMFTPDGRLRDEYQFLEEAGEGVPVEGPPKPAEKAPEPPPQAAPAPPRPEEPPWRPEPMGSPTDSVLGSAGPNLLDLMAMIAEPASVYLGDVPLPGGQSAEDLEMARLHIELLILLRQKTAGNLTGEESMVLEDVIYRLQMRYVEKQSRP